MLMDVAAYLCIALMIGVLAAMGLIVKRSDREEKTGRSLQDERQKHKR